MRTLYLPDAFSTLSVAAALIFVMAATPAAGQTGDPAISVSAPTLMPEAPSSFGAATTRNSTPLRDTRHHHIHKVVTRRSTAHASSSISTRSNASAAVVHPNAVQRHVPMVAQDSQNDIAITQVIPSAPRIRHRPERPTKTDASRGANSSGALDAMTRDGAAPAAGTADLGAQSLDVWGAIARTLAALAIVLATAYGVMRFLRKRGYGMPTGVSDDETEYAQSYAPAGTSSPRLAGWTPVADVIRQHNEARQRRSDSTKGFIPAGRSAGVQSIADLEFLGSEPLPNSEFVLYKVRVGDRILLLGGSALGALTALTEWDVEMRPETEERFEEMLSQVTLSSNAGISRASTGSSLAASSPQATDSQTAAQRIAAALRRASGGSSQSAIGEADQIDE